MRAWSIPGSAMSSTNVPRPVASLTLSTRRSGLPIVFSSDLPVAMGEEGFHGAKPASNRRKRRCAPSQMGPPDLVLDFRASLRRTGLGKDEGRAGHDRRDALPVPGRDDGPRGGARALP